MKNLFYLVAFTFIIMISFMGCNNANKAEDKRVSESSQVVDMHNAENALDYLGVYKGTIPAADCPGINVTLTLRQDSTFTSIFDYIDRPDSQFADSGKFVVNGNILTLTTAGSPDSYYKVEEGRVVMLTADRQPITGELKDKYILEQKEVY